MRKHLNILAISTGRNMLSGESQERARMRAYAAHVHKLHVVLITFGGGAKEITEGNLCIHPTNSRSKIHAFFNAYTLGKKILAQWSNVQCVVTAQDPFETGLIGFFLARASTAHYHIQVHGDFFGSRFWRKESMFNRVRYVVGLFLLRRAICIRVVSERIKKSLIVRGVRAQYITVLPIRPLLEQFLEIPRAQKASDSLTILTTGRLAPEKNIALVFRAFSRVRQTHEGLRLIVLGSGPLEQNLKNTAQKLGISTHTTFVPWTENVASVMRKADLFALASNYEGYGMVLVEALASGMPVVTTDVGCAGEVVQDSVHGYVVPVGDEDAFTEALITLINNASLRSACGARARETAKAIAAKNEHEYVFDWIDALAMCTKK